MAVAGSANHSSMLHLSLTSFCNSLVLSMDAICTSDRDLLDPERDSDGAECSEDQGSPRGGIWFGLGPANMDGTPGNAPHMDNF